MKASKYAGKTLLIFSFGLLTFGPAKAQVKVGDNPTQIVSGAKLQVDGDNTTTTPAKLIVTGTGNTGIGTADPGSTMTINGSLAGRYRIETNTTANISGTDYYVAYNGSANGTLTLPAAISGSGNYLGRVYHIKNTSLFSLTVAANGSEQLDNQTGAGVASITVQPGFAVMIISKGTTSGTTWEVVRTGSPTQGVESARIVFGASSVSNASATATLNIASTSFNTIANSTVGATTVSLPAGMYRATLTISGGFSTGVGSNVATARVNTNGSLYQTVGGYTTSGNNACTFGGSCIFLLSSAGTVSFAYFAQVNAGNTFTVTTGSSSTVATIERLQ